MAAGHTHDRITLICLPFLTVISWGVTRSWEFSGWLGGCFLFSGLMFGPDLDIHSKQSNRWGWLQWLWLPYRQWIPHRSILSHGPIIGTIIRLIYLTCWLVLVALLIQIMFRSSNQAVSDLAQMFISIRQAITQHPAQIIAVLLGLELGAMSHYVADFCSSKIKRWGKRSARPQKLWRKK